MVSTRRLTANKQGISLLHERAMCWVSGVVRLSVRHGEFS